jgi:hypothetical protein
VITVAPTEAPTATQPAVAADLTVRVDVTQAQHPISPLIYGVSNGADDVMAALRPTFVSWGGNPSSRYNWELGHAWNAGRDWDYRNGNYDYTGASASDDFIATAKANGSSVRLAVPTLGWVAKDDNNDTCSFPLEGGGCGDADGADCDHPGLIADPTLANVPSDVDSIVAWVRHLLPAQADTLRVIALDNEPDLWGYTHYDVHPQCTSYTEILDQYLSYATAIRAVAPEVELAGPNTCCWYYYWNSPAGAADKAAHEGADFLPWFLDQVRQHDEQSGVRTLDVLDVHYYPEGLYNADADTETAAHRLRSTRSLWDASYADESWISLPITLIPRLRQLIDAHYPGTKLGFSEWNWGADETMNGALAIAEVLGLFGREQLYYATYWQAPRPGSFGAEAFRLYSNYDEQGSRFGDLSVAARSDDQAQVASYAALDSATNRLHLILINKQPEQALTVALTLAGYAPGTTVEQFQLTADQPVITAATMTWKAAVPTLTLPAYSVTHLIFTPTE